jgi:hypothetical protein
MVEVNELSSLYHTKAMTILINLYAEAETGRISDDGTLTQEALSKLNPTTPEDTLDVAVKDLLSNGKVEMVSVEDKEETYEITDEGYELVDEYIPTDEIISNYERTDLSQTEIG